MSDPIQPEFPAIRSPESTVDFKDCPRCGGSGIIWDGQLEATRCNCGAWEATTFRRRLAAARIPARFRDKTLENYQTGGARDTMRRAVKESAAAYARGFSPDNPDTDKGLRLHGSIGVGKTHVAVAILREIIRRGYSGIYYNFSDLLDDLRNSFDKSSPLDGWQLLEDVDAADLLVLDDIGAESTSDWVRDRFYLIVNRRYESGKSLIVTTNLSLEQVQERMGRRTMSRLIEMCDEFVPFPNEDWRRLKMR